MLHSHATASFVSAKSTREKAQNALLFDKKPACDERVLHKTTDRHLQVGVENYRSTWVSSTEALVFQREERRRVLLKKSAQRGASFKN